MKKIALPSMEGFLFLGLLLMSSCGPEAADTSPVVEQVVSEMDLQVIATNGRMRSAPDPEAQTLRELARGTRLKDLGPVSKNTTRISYGNEQFDEPWLQVQDTSGQIGWIYAREVAPPGTDADTEQFRKEKRLLSLFGESLVRNIHQYQEGWEQAANQSAVAALYKKGLSLRDSLLPLLEERSYAYNGDPLPDLFWIESVLPAYVSQLVAEGTIYYLFNDYEQWLGLANRSSGQQDDRFFELMARCFPQDSIEYFYAAWELQTWDYGGHHLLGRGITYEILSDIQKQHPQTPLFSELLGQLKDQILVDLTRPDIHFWEPDSLVKQELDSIIQANWSIFTATDRVALDSRRIQLDSAALYGIGFNARAGE